MKDDTMIFDDKYFIGRKIKSFRKKRDACETCRTIDREW